MSSSIIAGQTDMLGFGQNLYISVNLAAIFCMQGVYVTFCSKHAGYYCQRFMLRDTQVLGKNKLLCLNCILLSMKGTAFISIFFLASNAGLICNRSIQQYAYDYQNVI